MTSTKTILKGYKFGRRKTLQVKPFLNRVVPVRRCRSIDCIRTRLVCTKNSMTPKLPKVMLHVG